MLWLWCRLTAVAPIRTLAWELPYVSGVALKIKTKAFVAIGKSQVKIRTLYCVKAGIWGIVTVVPGTFGE